MTFYRHNRQLLPTRSGLSVTTAISTFHKQPTLRRLLTWATALLILKVTAAVVWNDRNYLPPNFSSDFLRGRESYFWSGYHWPFYTHIASGPLSLLLGLILLSKTFRLRFPEWHRRLGRAQGLCVLLLVAPSGLAMAWYAQPGPIAALSFATLALATAACVALGWRAAVRRRFADHQRWMTRTFVLLCSAVALRVLGGLATVTGITAPWFDPAAAWACWLVPLAAYEWTTRPTQRDAPTPAARSRDSRTGFRGASRALTH